jgi:peptidoglycan/LPS O-acetylase OafA/YrhL
VTPLQSQRPFFSRVESLRGLGAMLVAAHHVSAVWLHGVQLLPHVPWEGAGAIENALGRLVLALIPGHAAVMLFFVISGFVLRVSLQHGPQDLGGATLRFLVARIFRIYPIVIVGTVVAALANGWELPAWTGHSGPLTVSTLVANLLLLDVTMNPTLWAIRVELLMVPAILLLYLLERSHGSRALIAIAIVTTLLSFSSQWAVWPPLSRNLFAFVLGMLIPTLGRDLVAGLSRAAANRWALAAGLALLLPGPLVGFYAHASAVIEAYAAMLLLSLVAYRLDLRGFGLLDAKPLRLLGLASGSYYVLHSAMGPWTNALAAMVVPASWIAAAPALVGILTIALWLVALAPLMLLSYYLVEAPGIALGRQVLRATQLRLGALALGRT